MTKSIPKVLAVASSGGHWIELLRLRPAFDGARVTYITSQKNAAAQVSDRVFTIIDGNQWSKLRLIIMLLQVGLLILRIRPDVVISTGAAPGYFALRIGKMLGARTLWLESLANAETTSLSTRMVRPYADQMLTQWPQMEGRDGLTYKGSVL